MGLKREYHYVPLQEVLDLLRFWLLASDYGRLWTILWCSGPTESAKLRT